MSTSNQRKSGILLHPSSLPGKQAVGDLGDGAETFIEWLQAAGQSLWQILPLGPTGPGNSPYAAQSSFAGNPLLISAARLQRDGLLSAAEIPSATSKEKGTVDFAQAAVDSEGFLRLAWSRMSKKRALRSDFAAFTQSPSVAGWLGDWTLFAACRDHFRDRCGWGAWPAEIARRVPSAMSSIRRELREDVEFHAFVQWVFFRQWREIRDYATERGINVVGDVPIYVSGQSADCWAYSELFQLDAEHQAKVVAGVPPDYFSETGQRWGNPLYRWDQMKKTSYQWWLDRIRGSLELADVIRLDHFRAFEAYWEIPADQETAIGGRWVPGPGMDFFRAVREELGCLPFIAEDLGLITPEVVALIEETELPGMKVLQFGFGGLDSVHAPHNHRIHSVVYTGTHDNDTTQGWFATLGAEERNRLLAYVGGDADSIHWTLMRTAQTSVARWAVIPMQDVLGLGSEARMNTPGTEVGNWEWRLAATGMTEESAQMLHWVTALGGRNP